MASELEVGKIVAKTAATTGTSPLEVARLEVKDEGIDLAAGMGPKLAFYMPHTSASFEGAAIYAKKESATDSNEATSLSFSTIPNAFGSPVERLTINSTGKVGINCTNPTVGQLQIDHASSSTLALTRTAGATTGTLGLVRFGNTDIDSNLANILVYQDNANDAAAIAFQTQATGASTATRLTIDSTGLATFTNGIKTEKGILSGTVLIDDDAVTTITPPRKGGFMKLIVDSATAEAGEYPQAAFSGEVFFDCGTSLQVNKSTGISAISGDLNTSTSDVSGTTGTDGKVTIAVQAGVIKIENRSNGQKRFNYLLYC